MRTPAPRDGSKPGAVEAGPAIELAGASRVLERAVGSVPLSGTDDHWRDRGEIRRLGTARGTRRRAAGLAVLLAVLAVVLLAGLALGSKPIGIGAVYDAFFHFRGSTDDTIVRGLRVPRTVLGL